MDIRISNLPTHFDNWNVTRELASRILHTDNFYPRKSDDDRLLNFKVKLNPSKAGGVSNDGTGILTLPDGQIGNRFLKWVNKQMPGGFLLDKKRVKFAPHHKAPDHGTALTLQRTPYIDPDIEEDFAHKMYELQTSLRVEIVQFGVLFRPSYSSPLRAYSIEWEQDYSKDSAAWLNFEYDHKLIRIKLGNDMTDQTGSSIVINFASISKIALGNDGSPNPYICFDTVTPPAFEEEEFYRAITGNSHQDSRKFRRRIGSLHPGHEIVAPYAQKLRITLNGTHDRIRDVADTFQKYCATAGLAPSLIARFRGSIQLEAAKYGYVIGKDLYRLKQEFQKIPWGVAFQMECLLCNCLIHTMEINEILPLVKKLCKEHPEEDCLFVAELLRNYCIELVQRMPSTTESPRKCFERVAANFDMDSPHKWLNISPGTFRCNHVTFAPTRIFLEGPYAVQSNRIIRRYRGYEHHFIRVDFRDEDRLHYRWDREVDGSTFLEKRVGGILKDGFELAGRRFEFLAYSTSALREHAVWFLNPFMNAREGGRLINAASIRDSIGDFAGTDLLKCPSKYAARLAQAFTATDPSVRIRRCEWEEIDDLVDECRPTPNAFTDGVGSISQGLGDEIWTSLCQTRRGHGMHAVQPSAYQIRFLGYKGVVAVDRQLDKLPPDGPGNSRVRMRLRRSMRKFENRLEDSEDAEIEIARAFEYPNPSYLNRPLVTILEDRGCRKEAFTDLLDDAVADVQTVDDSIQSAYKFLRSHNLGSSFRLGWIFEQLEKMGCDIISRGTGRRTTCIDTPFLQRLREVARMDVLREIKHGARIPIPNSYLLVGVADEGPTYKRRGMSNVYTLDEGNIFACIQNPGDDEPTWLEGGCTISRSPVAHPGDVQRVNAIGKPPAGMICAFAHLKNVVVFASVGRRSLPSRLGGGDLDGDMYDIIVHGPLLPSMHADSASYQSEGTFELDRDSTIEDICNFVVEYINSDVLGLLSDRLLVIADQSQKGIFDPDCIKLAKLCSQAVDYPKQGIPVDLDRNKLPPLLIRCKPDWHAAEVVDPRRTDYYESHRALGHMYRRVKLQDTNSSTVPSSSHSVQQTQFQSLIDPISLILRPKIKAFLQPYCDPDGSSLEIQSAFKKYSSELRYICMTHTLSNTAGVQLLEEEVVVGTILAKCSQKRWRKARTYRMKLHLTLLVEEVKIALGLFSMDAAAQSEREFRNWGNQDRDQDEDMNESARRALGEQRKTGPLGVLERAWEAWDFSLRRATRGEFGANSFGLIALWSILSCLDQLGPTERDNRAGTDANNSTGH